MKTFNNAVSSMKEDNLWYLPWVVRPDLLHGTQYIVSPSLGVIRRRRRPPLSTAVSAVPRCDYPHIPEYEHRPPDFTHHHHHHVRWRCCDGSSARHHEASYRVVDQKFTNLRLVVNDGFTSAKEIPCDVCSRKDRNKFDGEGKCFVVMLVVITLLRMFLAREPRVTDPL
ncbi:uncharacterized protein [Periplaneta americana]|uniref:uncharacterized protein n=1 Tax=Periplaneta americana TaxID=6978 RepID=UPI0037E73D29